MYTAGNRHVEENKDEELWVADSGSTEHLTSNPHTFRITSLLPRPTKWKLRTATSYTWQAMGVYNSSSTKGEGISPELRKNSS